MVRAQPTHVEDHYAFASRRGPFTASPPTALLAVVVEQRHVLPSRASHSLSTRSGVRRPLRRVAPELVQRPPVDDASFHQPGRRPARLRALQDGQLGEPRSSCRLSRSFSRHSASHRPFFRYAPSQCMALLAVLPASTVGSTPHVSTRCFPQDAAVAPPVPAARCRPPPCSRCLPPRPSRASRSPPRRGEARGVGTLSLLRRGGIPWKFAYTDGRGRVAPDWVNHSNPPWSGVATRLSATAALETRRPRASTCWCVASSTSAPANMCPHRRPSAGAPARAPRGAGRWSRRIRRGRSPSLRAFFASGLALAETCSSRAPRVVRSPRAARTAELGAHVGDALGERARIHGLDHRVRDLRRVGVGSMPGDAEGGDDDDVDGAVGPARTRASFRARWMTRAA